MSYPLIIPPSQGTGIVVSGQAISLDTSYSDTRYVNTTGDTMSGVLNVVGGSAATPGLSISGDSNTGLFSTTGDFLGLSCGGTSVLTMSSVIGNISSLLPIIGVNGTAAIPSYSFIGNADTGLYSSGSNDILFSTAGTNRLSITTTAVTSTIPYVGPAGSFSSPTYTFTNSPNSGLYAITSTIIALTVNSTASTIFSPSSTTSTVPVLFPSGTVSACSAQFGSNGNGIYRPSVNVLGFASNSVLQLSISSSSATFTNPVLLSNGTTSLPSVAFASDVNTGLYRSSSGVTTVVSSGVDKVNFDSSGINVVSGVIKLPNGTAAAPSYCFSGDTDTGFYSTGGNAIRFTAGGTQRFSLGTGGLSFFQTSFDIKSIDSSGLDIQTTNDGVTDITIFGHGVGYTDNVIRSQLTFAEKIDGVNGDRYHGTIQGRVINSGGDNNDYDSELIFSVVEDIPTVGQSSFKTMMIMSPLGIDVNSNKITGLATPTSSTDAATKGYVDSAASGLTVKDSVRVATTGNITLSGTQTIDGVSVVAADRVLVKNQTTGSQNGIYVASAGAWSRSTDADISAEVTSGMYCLVQLGTTQSGTGWILTTPNPITLGSTSLTFSQFSSSTSYIQGTGISISGNTVALDTSYTDTRYINATGDSMTGSLTMGGNAITGVAAPVVGSDATNKTYVDAAVGTKIARSDLKLLSFDGNANITVSDTHDSGMIVHTDAVVRSYTLGTGGSVGLTTTFVNNSSTSVTIVQGASTTVKETGTVNTGTRTLGANGMVTALKVNANTWFISGGVLS